MQNVTQSSDSQKLKQQKSKSSPKNNWVSDPAYPPSFQFNAQPGH